jgi:hypothetical protein
MTDGGRLEGNPVNSKELVKLLSLGPALMSRNESIDANASLVTPDRELSGR